MVRQLVFAALFASAAFAGAGAQSPLWGGLRPGRYGVGFKIIDTADATRSFPDASGAAGPRPMRLYVWYPATNGSGAPIAVRDLVPESAPNGGVMVPVDVRAFGRVVVRVRAGEPTMSDSAADALLATRVAARRNASPVRGRFPVVLLAPGQPLTMPVAAEFLASNGMLVIGVARKDARSFESMSFTPNASSIDAEADDLAFALAVARGRGDADASHVGLVGYSSSGLSNLAFAFRSGAPSAIAAFEGWEGWQAGQGTVRGLRNYDPRGFRAAYLLLEKTASEADPSFAKTSAFFDTMAYAPRWRIAFDGASHTDFASVGVALADAPATLRRNFVRAHEVLRDFFVAHLARPAGSARWNAPADESWMHVTSFAARPRVPTNAEFFHLAEVDPAAADTLASLLATLTPPVVPFDSASLSRLALLASQRRPADAARLRKIVARAYHGSAAPPLQSASPAARAGHLMTSAGAGGGVFLSGGQIIDSWPRLVDSLWLWTGVSWRVVSESGPRNRTMAAGAYDTRRNVLVVYGGLSIGNGTRFGDVWEWDGSRWEERNVVTPGPRDHHAMAYDEARGKTVMYGGQNADRASFPNDTWTWDGSVWTLADSVGGPGGLGHHSMAYDSRRQRVVLFGGSGVGNRETGDTWEWEGAHWERVATEGPGPRTRHRMAYDPVRGVVVMFGGQSGTGASASFPQDTWTWDGRRTRRPRITLRLRRTLS